MVTRRARRVPAFGVACRLSRIPARWRATVNPPVQMSREIIARRSPKTAGLCLVTEQRSRWTNDTSSCSSTIDDAREMGAAALAHANLGASTAAKPTFGGPGRAEAHRLSTADVMRRARRRHQQKGAV